MARNPEEVLAAAEALAREAEEFAAELMTTVEKASANFKRRASALRSLAVTNALASIGDGAPSVEEAPSVEGALQDASSALDDFGTNLLVREAAAVFEPEAVADEPAGAEERKDDPAAAPAAAPPRGSPPASRPSLRRVAPEQAAPDALALWDGVDKEERPALRRSSLHAHRKGIRKTSFSDTLTGYLDGRRNSMLAAGDVPAHLVPELKLSHFEYYSERFCMNLPRFHVKSRFSRRWRGAVASLLFAAVVIMPCELGWGYGDVPWRDVFAIDVGFSVADAAFLLDVSGLTPTSSPTTPNPRPVRRTSETGLSKKLPPL